MIVYFPRYELTMIKAVCIVQQQFQLGDDNLLAEFINVGMVEL